jgi:uncharacterized protein
MVDQRQAFNASSSTQTQAREFDAGLRAYMLKVYNYMTSGVLLTGIVALMTSQSPAILQALYQLVPYGDGVAIAGYTGLGWVALFSPFAFILAMNFGLNKMSSSTLKMVFFAFAATMGLSLSSIILMYTGESVVRVFFITAATFGSLSLYGYTTKKSLSGMGTFLMMGLFGIIIASVVNMFMQSSAMQFIISIVGVLIFAGLTAYDTQKIKDMYFQVSHSGEMAAKTAIMGATTLYLDFVNLFLMLLRLFGDRR